MQGKERVVETFMFRYFGSMVRLTGLEPARRFDMRT